MTMPPNDEHALFSEAVAGLLRGDFSRLDPLFEANNPAEGGEPKIIEWLDAGFFDNNAAALDEALTCACFNGRTDVAIRLLDRGLNPAGGFGTGMNAFHWAANRGQVDTVKLLLERKAPLEAVNMYGATVLGSTVWSAVNEPRPGQIPVIELLLEAGADITAAEYPSGDERVDALIRKRLNPA